MSNYKNEEIAKFSSAFTALSNPNRLRMLLDYLALNQPGEVDHSIDDIRSCLRRMGDDLELAPSTVSHHLKELRQAGLIHMERKGKQVACWVNWDMIREISQLFGGLEEKTG